MPIWYISDIIPYTGTINLDTVNIEYTVLELKDMDTYYMVTGYLDLSGMQRGSEVYVREYLDLAQGTYKKYLSYRFRGEQIDPLVMVTPKYLTDTDNYKLTLLLSGGQPISIPYKLLVFKYASKEM